VPEFGVDPHVAFAAADWLDDCPYFTPAEARAHTAVRVYGINRARRARGGMSLEDVEHNRRDGELVATGVLDADSGNVIGEGKIW